MPKITILYGTVLVVMGVGGYLGSGRASVTALIPAFFGIPLVILGFTALKEHLLKHAMHGAAVLGVLAVAGSARVMPGLFKMLGGEEVERPLAIYMQTLMFVLSLFFVLLCVKSFVDARKQREA